MKNNRVHNMSEPALIFNDVVLGQRKYITSQEADMILADIQRHLYGPDLLKNGVEPMDG
jgi:hypothetical protein